MSTHMYMVIAGFLLFCALLGCIGVVILMRASNTRRRITGRRKSDLGYVPPRSSRSEQRSTVIEARSRFSKHPEESSQGGWRA